MTVKKAFSHHYNIGYAYHVLLPQSPRRQIPMTKNTIQKKAGNSLIILVNLIRNGYNWIIP